MKMVQPSQAFIDNVLTLRRQRRMNQGDLAAAAGYSRPHISNMERRQPVSERMYMKIADVFNKTAEEMETPIPCPHIHLHWEMNTENVIFCTQCQERWIVGSPILETAHIAEVSMEDDGYALLRLPIKHPERLRLGPVDIDILISAMKDD